MAIRPALLMSLLAIQPPELVEGAVSSLSVRLPLGKLESCLRRSLNQRKGVNGYGHRLDFFLCFPPDFFFFGFLGRPILT